MDWATEFNGRSNNDCFLYLVAFLQSLIDRYILVGRREVGPAWMRAPPRYLARDKAVKRSEYKHCRRVYGRKHEVSIVALTKFSRVNFHYRDFARSSQCPYEDFIVGRLATVTKLFHSYIRKRNKGCQSVGSLKSSNGVIVSGALEK